MENSTNLSTPLPLPSGWLGGPMPAVCQKEEEATGWEEPSPESIRRRMEIDDGTAAWGDPGKRLVHCNPIKLRFTLYYKCYVVVVSVNRKNIHILIISELLISHLPFGWKVTLFLLHVQF